MIVLLLEEVLAELGHHIVGPVGRLDEAVEMARREAIDFGLLDINIDGSEVYPVAEALAARDIPFLFVTGYGKGGLRPPFGDYPTLKKPFRLRDLRKLLEIHAPM